jgi:hypothetical protein
LLIKSTPLSSKIVACSLKDGNEPGRELPTVLAALQTGTAPSPRADENFQSCHCGFSFAAYTLCLWTVTGIATVEVSVNHDGDHD